MVYLAGSNDLWLARQDVSGTEKCFFQGITYHSTSSTSRRWRAGGTTSTTLAAWRSAKGQERQGGDVGMVADPLQTTPGGAGALTNPRTLATDLAAYRLLADSPCEDAGPDLQALFSLDPGSRDLFGNPIPAGIGFAVGAHDPLVELLRCIAIWAESGGAKQVLDPGIVELPLLAPIEDAGVYTFEDLDESADHTIHLMGGAGVTN